MSWTVYFASPGAVFMHSHLFTCQQASNCFVHFSTWYQRPSILTNLITLTNIADSADILSSTWAMNYKRNCKKTRPPYLCLCACFVGHILSFWIIYHTSRVENWQTEPLLCSKFCIRCYIGIFMPFAFVILAFLRPPPVSQIFLKFFPDSNCLHELFAQQATFWLKWEKLFW